MIAIHNFHNAIEIILKAILLHYEIRSEKEFNITFESMMSEIDNFNKFKEKNIKLPIRQELINLNKLRNLVQHHASEPSQTQIEDYRVFARTFMEKSLLTYFKLEFEKLSLVDMIEDKYIKILLNSAEELLNKKDYLKSAIFSRTAFQLSLKHIQNELKIDIEDYDDTPYIDLGRDIDTDDLSEVIHGINDRLNHHEYFINSNLLGFNILDLKKFEDNTPYISFTLGYKVHVSLRQHQEIGEDMADWIFKFVLNMIIKWQLKGIPPKASNGLIEQFDTIINDLKGISQ